MGVKVTRTYECDVTGEEFLNRAGLARLEVSGAPGFNGMVELDVDEGILKPLLRGNYQQVVVKVVRDGKQDLNLRLPYAALDEMAKQAGQEQGIMPVLLRGLEAMRVRQQLGLDQPPQSPRIVQPKVKAKPIDYSSPAHAGRPHKGHVGKLEKATVRRYLDEINERLAREGHRQIDPRNPAHRELYGLPDPDASGMPPPAPPPAAETAAPEESSALRFADR